MNKTRIKDILKNISNRKYRNGFIKYLASLDYDEFSHLYRFYTYTLAMLINRYIKLKPRVFSKNWFKLKICKINYNRVFSLFWQANKNFVIKSNSSAEQDNIKIQNIVQKIQENNNIIQNLSKNSLYITPNPTQGELILFISSMVENLYVREDSLKLISELEELRKRWL